MRDLRHKAFEHVEIVALTLEEIQERKLQARADDHTSSTCRSSSASSSRAVIYLWCMSACGD